MYCLQWRNGQFGDKLNIDDDKAKRRINNHKAVAISARTIGEIEAL
jgi:hypothetical protein